MITGAAASQKIESGGLVSQGSFSIKATGKAFQILSSGLYSDKPRAIIRELACNAYDAHVAAGKRDLPFEVHLPNGIEPWFSVKDFGTGLSDSQVMKLYTTYFESTKTESNDFIGALGLGSKSPFSYVDSFTVVSCYKGWKRTYTAFIGEIGMPMIAKMSEERTDEPNGLEVSMPVNSGDFNVFQMKAAVVLRNFTPIPKILGARPEITQPEYLIDLPEWALYKSGSSAVALQGNVAYPIDRNVMTLHIGDSDVVSFLELGLELRFNIGELEVAASREALQYDKKTSGAIKARIIEVAKVLPTYFVDEVTKQTTLWDARVKFDELKQGISSYTLKNVLDRTMRWNGRSLTGYITPSMPEGMNVYYHVSRYNLHRHPKEPIRFSNCGSVQPSADVIVIWVDDQFRDLKRRLTHNVSSSTGSVFLIRADKKETFNLAHDSLGNPPYVKLSELEAPPPLPPAAPRIVPLRVLSTSNCWVETRLNVKEGGVFIRLLAGEPQYKGRSANSWCAQVVADARRLGLYSGDIIGIPATHKNIPNRYKGWVDFFELAEKEVKKLAKQSAKFELKLANSEALKRLGGTDFVTFANNLKRLNLPVKYKQSSMSLLLKAIDKLKAGAVGAEKAAGATRLIQIFGIKTLAGCDPIIDTAPLVKAVETAYPLLQNYGVAGAVYRDELLAAWVEYINMKDSQRRRHR